MADPMVEQMTRHKLRLLEKRLERDRGNKEGRAESALSSWSFDGQVEALHSALRRKKDLLQRLKEQYMLEDLNRPHTWGGTQRRYHQDNPPSPAPHTWGGTQRRYHQDNPPSPAPHTWGGTHRRYHPDHFPPPAPLPCPPAPIHVYQPAPVLPPVLPRPPFPAPPQQPGIIQQMWPQQPATIIQQLPLQQPLIQHKSCPQPYAAPRSGSIKEDMVELMLMQNAQMHQIMMHNMMLKALPPIAMSAAHLGQDFVARSAVKQRANAVHHHHYGPQALPPIGYPTWASMMPSLPAGQGGAHLPSVQHGTGPVTLPPLNTV